MNTNYVRKLDKEKLIKFHGEKCKLQKSTEVEENLRRIIRLCVDQSARFCQAVDDDEINKFLSKQDSQFDSLLNSIDANLFNGIDSSRIGKKIVDDYGKLSRMCNELTNTKNEESKLDYSNRMRFLLFRSLTGLSIALIVFFVSYMADIFKISLFDRLGSLIN